MFRLARVESIPAGDPSFAETLYRYGLDRADDKLSLLKNYEVLLSLQGRIAEAAAIRQRLNAMDDPSPFHWLQLARAAQDAAEFEDAIRYYRRALAIAPEMHEAYLGLAESQARLGKDAAAIGSLRKALEHAPGANTRQRYQAKLSALTHERG